MLTLATLEKKKIFMAQFLLLDSCNIATFYQMNVVTVQGDPSRTEVCGDKDIKESLLAR